MAARRRAVLCTSLLNTVLLQIAPVVIESLCCSTTPESCTHPDCTILATLDSFDLSQ